MMPRHEYPTQDRLREILYYDSETGEFRWRVALSRRVPIGGVAGSINQNGYRYIQIEGKSYREHILAWIFVNGVRPHEVDHRNLNKSDNRISNLRMSTRGLNEANKPKRIGTSSRFKGVWWNPRVEKWCAQIVRNRQKLHLGYFTEEDAAGAAYANKAKEFFGEFARIS